MIRSTILSSCLLMVTLFAGNAPLIDGQFHLSDQNGKTVETLAAPGTQVLVLIFAATDCPISNRYIPEVVRLEHDLASQGVSFHWVFPNSGETPAKLRQHDADFALNTLALLDRSHELVRMAHVAVTPEAAVFAVEDGRLREVYHGRIDDRYIAFGRQRPQATRHDLEQAIADVLAHRTVTSGFAQPVGCSILPDRP